MSKKISWSERVCVCVHIIEMLIIADLLDILPEGGVCLHGLKPPSEGNASGPVAGWCFRPSQFIPKNLLLSSRHHSVWRELSRAVMSPLKG